MKNTALQQLIDSWEERKPNGSYGLIWQAFIDEAIELLEIEREQIEEAFIAGMEFIPVDPVKYKEDSEQYYKDTYK